MNQSDSEKISKMATLKEDFKSIRCPTGHLTSRVMDFSLDLILSQISQDIRDQAYAFARDAFSDLITYDKNSTKRKTTVAKLKGAKNQKLLIIPCNVTENGIGHWFFATVVKGENVIRFYDSFLTKQRCNEAFEVIKEVLIEIGFGTKFKIHITESPQQSNTWDCGLFTIENAKMFLLNPLKITDSVTKCWFNPNYVQCFKCDELFAVFKSMVKEPMDRETDSDSDPEFDPCSSSAMASTSSLPLVAAMPSFSIVDSLSDSHSDPEISSPLTWPSEKRAGFLSLIPESNSHIRYYISISYYV